MIENNRRVLAAAAVFLLLTGFLWTTHQILNPILVGSLLIFLLLGLKEFPLARRLIFMVVLLLLIWFFMNAQGVIFPFIVSFILAYLFDPITDWLEKKKVPRTIGALLLLLVAIGLVVTFGAILIPRLVSEIQDLIKQIPEPREIYTFINKNLTKLFERLHIDPTSINETLLEEIPVRIEQVLSNLLKGISGVGIFLGQIVNIVLIPILTFYFLKDFNRIRNWAMDFAPKKYRPAINFYLWRSNRIFGGYIRGQLIVCSIVGVLTGVGFVVFKLRFALLIGFITGILNIIPYIGLYISLTLALLTGFFNPPALISMIKIAGIFLVVQMAESYVISPRIVGQRVGLHPIGVIFSILVFSRFLGFWGLIIGVPTAALIKFLVDEWKRRQKWRELVAEKNMSENSEGPKRKPRRKSGRKKG